MRSSNPVLTRLNPPVRQPQGYGGPVSTYPSPVVDLSGTDRMTVDDVVVRTMGLLAVTVLSGGVAWALIRDPALMRSVWIGAALVGLVIGLIISFRRVTNPGLILAYAVVEGVFVGMFSKVFETYYQGIVLQGAIGTVGIFMIMTALYKFRVIRNSPRFARGVMAAMVGVFALILVNWLIYLFTGNPGLRGGGPLSIIFSLVVIVVASLTFILDFDLIEQSVRMGAPRQMAWTCAFGLLVGLIWVYLEVVRLLSYLRGRN